MPQGFELVFNDYGAPTRHISTITAANAAVFKEGQAVTITNGLVVVASTTGVPAGFATANTTSDGVKPVDFILAREGDNFEVPYTGTPNAAFLAGAQTVALSADGLSVDAATVAGGALSVLSVNTVKKTCIVKVKKRVFS